MIKFKIDGLMRLNCIVWIKKYEHHRLDIGKRAHYEALVGIALVSMNTVKYFWV